MLSSEKFYVFSKWKDAPQHAFGSGTKPSVVPDEDKRAYNEIYNELMSAATQAQSTVLGGASVSLKTMNWSPQYGSRGHRPVDVWVALCGVRSRALAQMPQVYAIASERGLEVGFAASIDEADYHDPAVKARNRTIIPLLNAKMPEPQDALTTELDLRLSEQSGWVFNSKARLTFADGGFNKFGSLSQLIGSLKATASASGGGAVCRLYSLDELRAVDLASEFRLALQNFLPLIESCAPTEWDVQIITSQDKVDDLTNSFVFDPASIVDARQIVLAEIARRQGQAKFRKSLLKAYNGKCAITGTSVAMVLEAAHITSYLGKETNDVTNGILLRADIHTLFDLRFMRIDPETKKVMISEVLRETPYSRYSGQLIADTAKPSQRPSALALAKQFEEAPADVRRPRE